MMRDFEIQTLRNRIAQLAAEGREQERRGGGLVAGRTADAWPGRFQPPRATD